MPIGLFVKVCLNAAWTEVGLFRIEEHPTLDGKQELLGQRSWDAIMEFKQGNILPAQLDLVATGEPEPFTVSTYRVLLWTFDSSF
ncbi:hypothetical protein SLS62_004452 [Diatrype stigma]|uniref:Uncharacterized protein n=1 Tax=Diatrype stigma TaxID=117547 RepID=A0AAN9UQT4_9PEZI